MISKIRSSENALFDTGRVIDNKWILIDRVGKGGMGEVYHAHQLNLKRDVAIKVISEEILSDIDENPEEVANAMKRLQREVQTMAQVRHSNVLQIYDYGIVKVDKNGFLQQVPYVAMEYVPGNTFRYTMSDEGFDDETELLAEWLQHYLLPVLDGLESIHEHAIVHRDIKPENILMDGDTPKIADFGLARSPRLRAVSNSWDVKGTMPYMAPEQFADFRKAGFAADIYSIGKILYEAISGKLDQKLVPFTAVSLKDPETRLLRVMDNIIRKSTDENHRKRYQTVSELRFAILHALKSAHDTGRPLQGQLRQPAYVRWLWTGITATLLAVGGMTIYHVVDSGTKKEISVSTEIPDGIKLDPATLPETRVAADGREMTLVENPENGLMFYSDPSLVTFHHYVDFLNEVSGLLNVTDGVVRNNKDIWIYLGDGTTPADQLVYQHSRFHLRQVEWASTPVIRVTGLGALAYARHYNKSLPDYNQWQFLHQQFFNTGTHQIVPSNTPNNTMQSHMKMNTSSFQDGQSIPETGQRIIKEWLSAKPDSASFSHAGEWSTDSEHIKLTKRSPWEGFYDVGFRTVMAVDAKIPLAGGG
jgi:serine/threonine protein kinase